jgi:ABC-type dipeptide/oligopeptide/nickel transport system permease component
MRTNKISEFFSTLYGLTLFTFKSLYIIIGDSMKKEAQTYKEEREEQKKAAARKKL